MNAHDLNLQHLFGLSAAAAARSISRAAETLGRSQSALSQAIRALEADLDLMLVRRDSAGAEATPAGAAFIARIDRAAVRLRVGLRGAAGGDASQRAISHGLRRMTMTQLRAFTSTARTGSYSVAAADLGVTQPSVHRAAGQLEASIGVQCFERARHGVRVTEPGRAFARHAELALAEIRQGMEELAAARGEMRGRVAVGSLPLGQSAILPDAINRLLLDYPLADVQVFDGPYGDQLHALRHGRIDWVIGALRAPPPAPDVVENKLFDEGLSVVTRPDHPALRWRRITPERLAALDWIAPRTDAPARGLFNAYFIERRLAPPARIIECGTLLTARGMLHNSDRVAVFSPSMVREEIASGLLAMLLPSLPGSVRAIGYTVRADWRPTAVQQAFTDALSAP